ncbi:MerR family transcriptional regulator [Paenibacillus doosanensis]|uniref:HTH-type transcriptional regulator YfmP n=1 Tax=Paenibacillus konkukensis TaxID=2020716 RepID=A0ABY4RWT0_9BACL|nr:MULTISPECIES: MerR family transcriptional regulator [Paenibacillus]MCS7458640.1 MerR family transcriptional regulator [Paenibacillus doosanensis]UQZ86835.1 HTH-type transcriptional regulator YfmP [Paenibacillus konkukensis]
MKISELSRLTGASVRSLRHYEEQGLLTPRRLDNGYREYHDLAVEQVRTIRFYLKLGLTTAQISGFLHCVMKNKEAFCEEVLPVYKKKLRELNEQIELLTAIRSNLEERIRSIHDERSALQGFDEK